MLQFDPPLHLSEEDFDHLTDGHRLCTEVCSCGDDDDDGGGGSRGGWGW